MNYINGSDLIGKHFIKLENGDLREVNNGHFIPAKGELFYFVNAYGKIINQWNNNIEATKWLLEHQPVFRTEKECVEYLKYVNSLDKYATKKVLSNPTKDHWYLVFDLSTNEIHTLYSVRTRYPAYCFNSYEDIQRFKSEVGEKCIKQFMFNCYD